MEKKIKSTKFKRIFRVAIIHIGAAALISLWLWLTGCPIYRLTGAPCPGCGMTRALLALCRFDFKTAFYYHPLVFVIPFAVLYLVHRKAWKLLGGRKTAVIVAVASLVLLFVVYIIRGIIPDTFVSNAIQSSVFAS